MLCAKTDEAELWEDYCKETQRTNDLILFKKGAIHETEGQHNGKRIVFNPLDYEMRREGDGAGETQNIVNIFMNVYRMGNRIAGEGDNKDDRFWDSALKRCISRVVDVIKLSGEDLSFNNMAKILSSNIDMTKEDIGISVNYLLKKNKLPHLKKRLKKLKQLGELDEAKKLSNKIKEIEEYLKNLEKDENYCLKCMAKVLKDIYYRENPLNDDEVEGEYSDDEVEGEYSDDEVEGEYSDDEVEGEYSDDEVEDEYSDDELEDEYSDGDNAYSLAVSYFTHSFKALGGKTRATIVESFMGLAEPFLGGLLSRHFAGRTNIFPEWTFEKQKIIVLDFPIKEFLEAGIIGQCIFKLMFQQAIERRDVKKFPVPVFLWADEAQYFINPYDQIFLTTARSSKTSTVFLTQNISNYLAVMGGGKAKVDSLLGNLSTKIFHANTDAETNEYASRLIGNDLIAIESASEQKAEYSLVKSKGHSYSMQFLPQVKPKEFTELLTGGEQNNLKVTALIMVSGKIWSNGSNYKRIGFTQTPRKNQAI